MLNWYFINPERMKEKINSAESRHFVQHANDSTSSWPYKYIIIIGFNFLAQGLKFLGGKKWTTFNWYLFHRPWMAERQNSHNEIWTQNRKLDDMICGILPSMLTIWPAYKYVIIKWKFSDLIAKMLNVSNHEFQSCYWQCVVFKILIHLR